MSDVVQQEQARVDGVAGLKKQKIGPLRIACILYCLVAAGAFGIETLIPIAGPGLTILTLIVFPVIWALPICLVCSELTTLMPAEGGLYVWAKEALGEFWGFVMGWWNTICIYLGTGVYVVLVVGYVGKVVPLTEGQAAGLKIVMVLIFTIVNLLGLREVSWLSTVFSIIILIAFAIVTVVGFMHFSYNPMDPFLPPETSMRDGIGLAVCFAIWLYCGYDCVSNIAGEIEKPRNIAKGFMIAMPLIALSYFLPTVAGLGSVGNWELWSTVESAEANSVDYSTVLTQYLGSSWGVIFLIIAIVGQCAIFNSYFTVGSRGFFVLADDNLCPKFLRRVSQSRGVPYFGVILLAVTTMILSTTTLPIILMITVPIIVLLYILASICFFVFRRRYPVADRPKEQFVIGGGKVGAALCGGVPIVVGVVAMLVNGTEYFLLGFISILSAPLFYLLFKGIYKGTSGTRFNKRDIKHFGLFLLLTGALAISGYFFLGWYEGDWGAGYYLEMYGAVPSELLEEWATYDPELYPDLLAQYGTGLTSDFGLMLRVSLVGGIVCFVIGAVLSFIGRRVTREAA